jgi:8-oxo-dGTP diphosphatase
MVVVAAGVIRRDGRVLITRRMAGAHLAGYWEFPGGKVEAGEDPEAALVRELGEELGIEAEVGRIEDVAFHRDSERSVLLLFYGARIIKGEPRDIGVSQHVWVTTAQLDDYEFPPADERLIARLRGDGSG